MKKIILASLILTLFLGLNLEKAEAVSHIDQKVLASLQAQILEIQKALDRLRAQEMQMASATPSPVPQLPFEQCARITISWNPVSGAEYYKVYRNGVEVFQGNQTNFTDSDLIRGRNYSYQISAVNQAGESPRSRSINRVALDPCPPRLPTSFNAQTSLECGGKIRVSWSPAPGALSYELKRGRTVAYQGPVTSFTDSDLTSGREYSYSLTAIGATGLRSEFPETVSGIASEICPPKTPEIHTPIVEEGFFSTSLANTPSDSNSFKLDTANRRVIRFGVKANDSDMTINRMDVSFDKRPWLYFDRIRIRAGTRTIFDIEPTADDFTQLANNNFRLRISGLNREIRKDRTTNFEVRVDAKQAIPGGTPQAFKVYLPNNAVRGVDAGGFMNFAPTSGGGIDGDFSRTFTISGS